MVHRIRNGALFQAPQTLRESQSAEDRVTGKKNASGKAAGMSWKADREGGVSLPHVKCDGMLDVPTCCFAQ
jgi:hypothetical protein